MNSFISTPAKGYTSLLSGYIGWGLFPLYWQLLAHISPLEVTLHRIIWAVPVLMVLIHLSARRKAEFRETIRTSKQIKLLIISSILITINWGIYVWAVAHSRVVEASMGYFLSPLISILAGMLIFKEKISRLQKIAIGVALLSVIFQITSQGKLPWVAMGVGISFALYGVLRKIIKTGALVGLYTETLIMAPIALIGLIVLYSQNKVSFLHGDNLTDLWLILGGLVTVAPLALFTIGARSLPLTTVGVLFFITPSMQFVTGAILFNEPMDNHKILAFIIIWISIVLYAVSLMLNHKNKRSV